LQFVSSDAFFSHPFIVASSSSSTSPVKQRDPSSASPPQLPSSPCQRTSMQQLSPTASRRTVSGSKLASAQFSTTSSSSRHNTFPSLGQPAVVSDSDDFTFLPSFHGTAQFPPFGTNPTKTQSPLLARRPLSAANPNIDSHSCNPMKQI
uniref:Protein kinase domain-containing protein n=1 Tax=Gongylonema pulchrum TaxID=637853 RepID=A0A183D9W4_9BILA